MRFLALPILLLASMSTSVALAESGLSVAPPNPSALQTIRLRYSHVGCTDPDSVRVVQSGNAITVTADTLFQPDCGTVNGSFEDFTIGRLPAGEYEVTLDVAPVPGSPSAITRIGSIHLSVAPAAPTNALRPHDNYSDMWWTPSRPGTAISVFQANERLFMVWNAYDAQGHPTWFVVPDGRWIRGNDSRLAFTGVVYATSGTGWSNPANAIPFAANPVGTAQFVPLDATHARVEYVVQSVAGSILVERFVSS